MNRKQLSLILVAVVVLGGLGLWLRNRNAASYRTTQGTMGQKVLGEFDLNSVAQILVRQGTNELNLVQRDEVWIVKERGGYPAAFSEVSDFLRKLWELKTIQVPPGAGAQLARLELNSTGDKPGTVLDLKDKTGQTIRSVILGKKHMRQAAAPSPLGGEEGWPDGRYVMVSGKPESVSLVSETFSNIEPKPE